MMHQLSQAGERPPGHREYWLRQLAGASDIALAPDWHRPPGCGRSPSQVRACLPAGLLDALAGAGRARFAVLLAAWYVVLHRHTGQADLLVGARLRPAPAADASTGAGERLTVVPLRTVLDPAAPFEALRARTSQTVAGALRHSAGPDPAALCAAAGLAMRIGFGVLDRPRVPAAPGAEFDLELVVEDADGETAVRLAYDAAVYSWPTAARLLRHFTTVLAQALREPGSAVRGLRVETEPVPAPSWPLTRPEGWVPAVIGSESLVDRFRSVAAEHPGRPAVSGISGTYTYADLDRVSTAMAGQLSAVARPGQRLALLCEHDIGLAVGIWSILKRGCSYLPLDPRLPDSRLAATIADTEAAAVVCDAALAARAAGLAGHMPVAPIGAAARATGSAPLPAVAPDDLAYLLHTSGTTGGPKSVMQAHSNVLAHSLTYANRTRIRPDDRIPLLARFTFDLAVMDFFGALLTGASIHIIDPVRPTRELWDRLAEVGASMLHCTPTLYRHLVRDGCGAGAIGPERAPIPDTIRLVVLGGERVTRDDLQSFFGHFPDHCALVTGLSATECSVALQHVARRCDMAAFAIPAGHAVEGVQVRLIDDDGRPTEVFGEVELLTDRVALGYWNRPAATAAVFGEHLGQRSYRTGDLARRLPDGALVHCGRKDRQVKIRGHRVEPGEIECLLRLHSSVAQAAVLVDQRTAIPRLIAYVTPAASRPLSPDGLCRYLGRQLPDYMVPTRILQLEALPVGPTGKLDYSRLPLPGDEPPAADREARTGLERAVADIWCQVLGLARIGADAHFMASGGDSLQLMTMIARLKQDLHADIPLADFLREPTISAIVNFIDRDHLAGGMHAR